MAMKSLEEQGTFEERLQGRQEEHQLDFLTQKWILEHEAELERLDDSLALRRTKEKNKERENLQHQKSHDWKTGRVEEAEALVEQGRYREAIKSLKVAYKLTPSKVIRQALIDTYGTFSLALLKVNQHQLVVEELEQAKEQRLLSGISHSALACAYCVLGRWDSALSDIQEAISYNPHQPSFHLQLARVLAVPLGLPKRNFSSKRLQHQQDAVNALAAAYKLAPGDSDVLAGIDGVLDQLGGSEAKRVVDTTPLESLGYKKEAENGK